MLLLPTAPNLLHKKPVDCITWQVNIMGGQGVNSVICRHYSVRLFALYSRGK